MREVKYIGGMITVFERHVRDSGGARDRDVPTGMQERKIYVPIKSFEYRTPPSRWLSSNILLDMEN